MISKSKEESGDNLSYIDNEIQWLTNELNAVRNSVEYKSELRRAEDKINEICVERYKKGYISKYLVINQCLYEALSDELKERQWFLNDVILKKETKPFYRTCFGVLEVIPLNTLDEVIMVG